MLKNIKNLGQTLNSIEKKSINGGSTGCPNNPRGMCPVGYSFDIDSCTCLPEGFTI